MITVNTYHITNRAVEQGVTTAVEQLLKKPETFQHPEQVVGSIVDSVMEELSSVFDFGIQPIRLTSDMKAELFKYYASNQQEKEQ
jgi:hypothetical protein